jgi:hypothetical protein
VADIMTLKAIVLLEAFRLLSSELQGAEVMHSVDNWVLAAALLTGSCRHRATQAVIRAIFHLGLSVDIHLVPRGVSSDDNALVDALSLLSSPSHPPGGDHSLTPRFLAPPLYPSG